MDCGALGSAGVWLAVASASAARSSAALPTGAFVWDSGSDSTLALIPMPATALLTASTDVCPGVIYLLFNINTIKSLAK